MSQITIPGLPNNATPPNSVLFEISNAGVSENTSIQQIIDTAGLELKSDKNIANGYPGLDGSTLITQAQIPELPQSRITDLVSDLATKEDTANKGANSGYAGLDAAALLLLVNYPSGNALEILRRNAANDALEFTADLGEDQTPILSDIDYAGFTQTNVGAITFNEVTEPSTPATDKIVLWAEEVLGVPLMRYKADDGVINNASENLYIQVRNITGGTLLKGQVVYITGAQGNNATVDLAIASDQDTIPASGFLVTDVNNNSNAFCLVQGRLTGINTSAFSVGDTLYVSDTVPGAVTATKPTHPNLRQIMGGILVSNVGSGEIGAVTGQVDGEDEGTVENTFNIGDGNAGTKTLNFTGDFATSIFSTPTANRNLTLPDITDTLVGKTTTDIFTNKTLDLSLNTVTMTFAELNTAVSDATIVDLVTGQILTNKTIDAASNTISNIGFGEVISDIITGQTLKATAVDADEILLSDSTSGGALRRTTVADFLADVGQTPITQNVDYASFNISNLGTLNTNTIPGGTDAFAMLTAVQTLTNKSIDLLSNTLTSTFAQLNAAVSDATLVDLSTTQTLTNKTLDDATNTITGIFGITGLATQVQALNMADNNIIFGTTTGGQIGTSTTQKIGFYGATPIVQPIDGATLTNNITVGGTTDALADYSDLTTYATDATTIRNNLYQLGRKVKIITDNLRALGIES